MLTAVLTALLLAAPPAPSAPASQHTSTALAPKLAHAAAKRPLPNGMVRLRYALKLVGQTIGEPEIHVAPIERLKSGRSVRKLTFKSAVSPRLLRLYRARTDFVTILDAESYTPIRSHYDQLYGDRERTLDIRYSGAELTADVMDRGKPTIVRDTHLPGMVDTISSAVWLAAQDLKVGQGAVVPHHSTNHRYFFFVDAVAMEDVTVPAGTFRATRIECRLFKPPPDQGGHGTVQSPEAYAAATGFDVPKAPVRTFGPPTESMPTEMPTTYKPTSSWTLWLTDDRWRTPVRLLAEVPVLGNVSLDMTSRRLER